MHFSRSSDVDSRCKFIRSRSVLVQMLGFQLVPRQVVFLVVVVLLTMLGQLHDGVLQDFRV